MTGAATTRGHSSPRIDEARKIVERRAALRSSVTSSSSSGTSSPSSRRRASASANTGGTSSGAVTPVAAAKSLFGCGPTNSSSGDLSASSGRQFNCAQPSSQRQDQPSMVRGSYSPGRRRGRTGGRSTSGSNSSGNGGGRPPSGSASSSRSRSGGRSGGSSRGSSKSRSPEHLRPSPSDISAAVTDATPVHANTRRGSPPRWSPQASPQAEEEEGGWNTGHDSSSHDSNHDSSHDGHGRRRLSPPPPLQRRRAESPPSPLPNHALVDDASTLDDTTTRGGGSTRGGNTSKGSTKSREAYTRIMHQYMVQSSTNPLTKRAAASVIIEATNGGSAQNEGSGGDDRPGLSSSGRPESSASSGRPPRNSPPDPSALNTSTTTSTNSNNNNGGGRLRSLMDADSTTVDSTTYADNASTISSLSSGSGRRAAYRSLVHFLPSLLPPPSTSSPSKQRNKNRGDSEGGGQLDEGAGMSADGVMMDGGGSRSSHGGSGSEGVDSWDQSYRDSADGSGSRRSGGGRSISRHSGSRHSGSNRGGSGRNNGGGDNDGDGDGGPDKLNVSTQSDETGITSVTSELRGLDVSGISHASSSNHMLNTSGSTAATPVHGKASGPNTSFRSMPTPTRSGSRPRDPDGPVLGRRAQLSSEEDEEIDAEEDGVAAVADGLRNIRAPHRRPQQQSYTNDEHQAYDGGGRHDGGSDGDSDTLGSLDTDGNNTNADSEAAGFYPADAAAVGGRNVARDVLSKYGSSGSGASRGGHRDTAPASARPPQPPPRPLFRTSPATATASTTTTRPKSPSPSLRIKARAQSPANKRPTPPSSPSPGPPATSAPPAPPPAPSPPANKPPPKAGGIAARIAMFERSSSPPKPQQASPSPSKKKWSPPNDIPMVRPVSPTPGQRSAASVPPRSTTPVSPPREHINTSHPARSLSPSMKSDLSRASSIPFDEEIDRRNRAVGMRAAGMALNNTRSPAAAAAPAAASPPPPVPEVPEVNERDMWREKMVMGQRTVQANSTAQVAARTANAAAGAGASTSNAAQSPLRSRSVSPRKPQWKRAGTSPSRTRDPSPQVVTPAEPPEKAPQENKRKPQWQSSGQTRAARLARHRQRSISPQKKTNTEQEVEEDASWTKSVLNQPATGNRVRWSRSLDDEDDINEAMIINAATRDDSLGHADNQDNRAASPPKLQGSARDSPHTTGSPRSSRSRANAALQARRRHQAQGHDRRSLRAVSPPKAAAPERMPQDPPESPTARRAVSPRPSNTVASERQVFSPPPHPSLEAPDDEEDELGLPEISQTSPPRLGIGRTDYGRSGDKHGVFEDDEEQDEQELENVQVDKNTYSDEFDVDRNPEAFGSEDEDSSNNSTPVTSPRLSPEPSPRSFAERKMMAARGEEENVTDMVDRLETTVAEMESPEGRASPTSRAASFIVSIADVELFGAKELSLAFASKVEPTVEPQSLVRAALSDSVRAEESKLIRERGIDFVSIRRQMGHSVNRRPGQPIRHLDDIMEDVVLAQEIALDKLEIGDYDGAMGEYMAVVSKCEDGTYEFADERVQDQLTGTIMHNIAVLHMKLGILDICPQLWDETVLTRRDANPELGIFQHDVATSLNEMGIALFACKQYDKAVRAFADVIYIRQEIHGVNNAYLATAINNIGIAHFALESLDKALEAFEEALQVYRLAMLAASEEEENDESGMFDGARNLLLGISTTLCNVAYVRATQGAYAEAREALNEALEIQEAVLEAGDPRMLASLDLLSKMNERPFSEDVDNPPTLGLSGVPSFSEDSQVENPFHNNGFKDSKNYRDDFDPFGDDISSAAGGYDARYDVPQQQRVTGTRTVQTTTRTTRPTNLWENNRQTSF